jgi:ELWxxDGT repeat protein
MKNSALRSGLLLFAFSFYQVQAQIVEKVAIINPAGNSYPSGFSQMNNILYFSAFTDTHGRELWRSDGTETGTYMVKDIHTGTGDSSPAWMTEFNGKLYFYAGSGSPTDIELWVSDGTETGTILLKNIHPLESSEPFGFKEYNGYLYFAAKDDTGAGLWRTDGTVTGTEKVKPANIYTHTIPGIFNEFNGKLYFMADYPGHAYKLWVTDGTTAGTIELAPVGTPDHFVVYNGKLYFTGSDAMNDSELWSTDGTAFNTVRVKNINAAGHSNPWALTVFNNYLYFGADDGVHGTELWRSDGTESGTLLFGDIEIGAADSWPDALTVYDNKLYFAAYTNVLGNEIWVTDGINPPILFSDINTSGGSNPWNLHVSHNKLYFVADEGINGHELWYTDGNPLNIVRIMPDIAPEFNPCFASEFYEMNGVLYFSAAYTSHGLQLYKVTDSSASINKPIMTETLTIYPNPASDYILIHVQHPQCIRIYDRFGRLMMNDDIMPGQKLQISNLAKGIYYIQTEEDNIAAKFIKI